MFVLKKIIALSLCLCLAFLLCAPAFAHEPGDARAVIGASLTEEQTAQVYSTFGVSRGSVPELTVTNAEEREYLDGFVDPALIGTNSISCVYLELLPAGEGLQIETSNLTWCTSDMFVNALVTGGVEDAKIIVTAPFEVSGTAALTGIYKAYEDLTGQKLDDAAKLISTQELVVTGELADAIGSYDALTIVNEIKLILAETSEMTDEELHAQILEVAEEYGVTLHDSQVDQLITLCRAFEKMNPEQLREKVEYVQTTVKKLAAAQEKVAGITEKVKDIVQTVTDFINRVISFFKKG